MSMPLPVVTQSERDTTHEQKTPGQTSGILLSSSCAVILMAFDRRSKLFKIAISLETQYQKQKIRDTSKIFQVIRFRALVYTVCSTGRKQELRSRRVIQSNSKEFSSTIVSYYHAVSRTSSMPHKYKSLSKVLARQHARIFDPAEGGRLDESPIV